MAAPAIPNDAAANDQHRAQGDQPQHGKEGHFRPGRQVSPQIPVRKEGQEDAAQEAAE